MKKLIDIPSGRIIAEKSGKLWYARYMDTLIVMPTLTELKKHITETAKRLQTKYN